MIKKFIKKKCFSVTIKNLNCETLTKILVTFKRQDGVKDEKLWGFTEKSNFQEEIHEKPIYMRELPKKGGLGSLKI